MYSVHFIISNAAISILLVHIFSTRKQSNTADSNKIAYFSQYISVSLCDVSLACAKELASYN